MSWTDQNWDIENPRFVADLTGDGRADIVGFGTESLWVALNNGNGTFQAPQFVGKYFDYGSGWRVDQHPRFLADLTGDGGADIVGFGNDGVWVALNNGNGTFKSPQFVLADMGYNQGWRTDQHPRFLADLTGNGRADIVGFGFEGVWVALNNGDGTFQAAKMVTDFGSYQSGWRVEQHPRFLADLTGDGRADIIGLGNDGGWAALNNGDGTFKAPKYVLADMASNQGWRVDQHPRFLVDMSGDGRADIIGFFMNGAWVAFNNGDGSFRPPQLVTDFGGYDSGWRVDQHPRFLTDLTGDGGADIVGFGNDGVWVALNNGNGTFKAARMVTDLGSYNSGWRVAQHPRFLADLTGDGRADIIGLGNDGVWVALNGGDGTFEAPQFELMDFGYRSGVKTKVVSLDFLQRKFNEFFNEREQPLFQVRLDSKVKKFGQSAMTVAMFDPLKPMDDQWKGYDHDHPIVVQELAGPGERLSFDLIATYYYYFQDVKSDGLTVNVIPGPSPAVEVVIHFETGGPIEIKVDGHTGHDIDFDGFNIKLHFGFGVHNGLIDLLGFLDSFSSQMDDDERSDKLKQFINTDVSVNVDDLPDGTVASRIENTINSKIYDALNSNDPNNQPSPRESLNRTVTKWLVGGGDYQVTGLSAGDQGLSIEYLTPPNLIEPFPENPQLPLEQGLLANIEHIVVLMMENRSFDHMIGYLSKEGGRTDIDGLRGGETNRYKGRDYPSFLLPDTTFIESPCHEHECAENQIDGGKCDGFVASFAEHYPEVDPGRIMGYHNAAHVPVYDVLAREFLICERWFAAHPGPTFCNRFYTLTGRLNRDSFGSFEFNNFTGSNFRPVSTKTIFDHLTDHGVRWNFYEHRYCSLRLFERYTTDDNFIVDANDSEKGFFASAATGNLPSVSFIDPNFIDEFDGNDNDDGAPCNIAAGQNLIGRVVNAVVQGKKWDRTLLLITYDEHGGFYDHISPLDSAFRETAKAVSDIDHYGLRVPTFVISPWVKQGGVSNVVFDHTSIAKTIARCFMSGNPPDMGERVAVANDLSMVMSSTSREDRPVIPVPDAPPPRSRRRAKQKSSPDSADFKEVMRVLNSRYPIRK
jgi:phospholipase C